MIYLYFHTNDPSKRKAVKWLEGHQLVFTQRNIERQPLNAAEIRALFSLSLNGTDDLVSKRSKDTKALTTSPDDLTVNQLVAAIEHAPHILKNPIIFDQHKLITGFDKEKMGIFIPAAQRKSELSNMFAKLGSNGSNKLRFA